MYWRNQLGMNGERWAQDWLRSRYKAVVKGQRNQGDLWAVNHDGEILKVEVKTGRLNKDGAYRFTVRHERGCDVRKCDLLLLQACTDTVIYRFLVPVSVVGDRKRISFRGHPAKHAGWLSAYRIEN